VSDAAEKVARGHFDIDLPKRYHFGELGRLEYAFKHMANALKNQTQKHETLISISDQIMGVPNIDDSLEVILKFALKKGVSSVRIVLTNEVLLHRNQKTHLRFGKGKNTRLYAYLDNEIMALTKSRGMLVMSDVHIGKALNIAEGMPYPDSLLSIPLKKNDVFFGVLWLAYGQRKWFAEGEVNYFEDLAKRASTAINTASAFNVVVTSKKRYEAVLDSLRDPVLIGDIDGRLIYVNPAAAELPGVGVDKFMGRLIQNIFRNEDLTAMIEAAKIKPQTQEIEFTNGKIYQVMVSTIRLNEQRSGYVTLLRDISHYKELDDLKTEFVATVSHELRTPLTLILGYAQILKMIGNMNNQQETYLKKIIDGVEEMKTLVQNLLDFGRLEAGDALDISHVVAGDVVHQVVGSIEVHAEKKNIQINLAMPEDPVLLEADITFLTQALKNLVENAIKFTPMGGKVDIGLQQKDQNVVFVVRDNGIGIAPLDQRRLFEKFYQAGSHAPQNQKGSGLGLAIVKSIIERHGGRVWFESQLGKGSVFYMEIPVKQLD
jgi:two-component system NtrC family sensor kinase